MCDVLSVSLNKGGVACVPASPKVGDVAFVSVGPNEVGVASCM